MAKLHFYYSAMNAGKTTTLLQSNYNYHERGMKTLLYKPDVDNRIDKHIISSRIGLSTKAINFNQNYNFQQEVGKINFINHIDCLLLDEAQFLTKNQVKQLTIVVDQLNIPVLAYGLRTDFLGKTFPGSQYLLAWADTLIEIKTICFCGTKATMNLRIDNNGLPMKSGKQIKIGGNNLYESVCRKHFYEYLN